MSYWRKKFGFDISTNYSYNADNTTGNTVIKYQEEQRQLNSSAKSQNSSNRGGINLSSYYNLNDHNSIDMQFKLSSNKIDYLTNSTIDIYSAATFDRGFSNINDRTSTLYNSASLNYTHKYNKSGNVFYFLSNFFNSTSNENQLLNSSIDNGNGLINSLSVNDINSTETTFEVLQQHNSNKKFRYTFGTKLIIRNNKNDHSIDEDNLLNITPVRMQQTVGSIYSDADWTINKFKANAGLRFDYNSNRYTDPIILRQSFAKLTPVISLTYNINPIHLLLLSYSRRITRPGFYATSPVTNPVSAYEERTGTANLHNQISNDWGIQYYGNYKFARIGFNLRYGHLSGAIRDLSILDSTNTIQTLSTNVNLNESYAVGFSADFKLLKKLHFSHFSNLSYELQHNGIYSSRKWSGYLSDRASYQVNEQNSFDLSLLTYSPNINLQGVEQSMSYLNWSLNYGHYFDLMKNFPTAISVNLSNPNLYNGLPGYSTVNAEGFSKRQDTKRSNAVVGISIRVQFKGKKYANRTFNKVKSIQNNDLSSPGG